MSPTTTTARDTVLAAFGVASVAVGIAVALGVAPASILGPVAGLNPTEATGVLGLLLLAFALHRRRRNDANPGPTRLVDGGESVEPTAPGEEVDAVLRTAQTGATAYVTREQREQVRERVRTTAVRAYRQRHGASREAAVEAVATGAWTDDVVAAAFVGDQRAPRLPLRERLRGWLHPDQAYRRRTERATRAVHDLAREVAR